MQIVTKGVAGTMESSDIIVRIEPAEQKGIELTLTSAVMQQFGKQIEKVIRETLAELGVENCRCERCGQGGALTAPLPRSVKAAAYRAAQCDGLYLEDEAMKRLRRSMLFVPGNNPGMILRRAHLRLGFHHVRSGGLRFHQ